MKPPPDEKYIRTMFDSFAARYDTFTFLIGFGQAERLRQEALGPLRENMRVLDLACGTGDLALAALEKVGERGEVVGLDFSPKMLEIARQKYQTLKNGPGGHFRLVCARAEDLPVDETPFDLVVSGFALRNLYANIGEIISRVYRSLKPGGQISLLDLTEPRGFFRKKLFKIYLSIVVGCYGLALFGKEYPVPYLPDSADRFFKADEFVGLLKRTGFKEARARSFMLGAVTLYQAKK